MRRLVLIIFILAFTGCGNKSKSEKERIVEKQPEASVPVQVDSSGVIPPDAPAPTSIDAQEPTPVKERPKEVSASENSIRNKRWRLVEMHGNPVMVTEAFSSEPYITLSLHSDKMTGSGGCNRFGCKYSLADDKISFAQFAATKKACKDVMPIEGEFLRALEAVTSYKQDGDTLWLLKDGKRILKFAAVYL